MAAAIHLLVPKTAYTLLLESVDRKLPIYEMLVNGIVEKDCKGGERVEFSAISLKKIKNPRVHQKVTPAPDRHDRPGCFREWCHRV